MCSSLAPVILLKSFVTTSEHWKKSYDYPNTNEATHQNMFN